jgi:hypothetical protein
MTRYLITKRALQVVAVLTGLEGGFSLCMGVWFLFPFPSIQDGFGAVLALLFPVLLFLFGGIFLAVAYKLLRDFSPDAIRHLLIVLAFLFWGLSGPAFEALERTLAEHGTSRLLQANVALLPLVAAWVFHKVMTAVVAAGLRREQPPTAAFTETF